MAKEPFVIPARPDQRDLPPRQQAIFFVGGQRYQIRINTLRELPLPSPPAEVIPIDRKRRRQKS